VPQGVSRGTRRARLTGRGLLTPSIELALPMVLLIAIFWITRR
jgi:hypothetical protein